MTRSTKLLQSLILLLGVLALGACKMSMPNLSLSGGGNGGDLNADGFQKNLVIEYNALADFEKNMLDNEQAADHFKDKARKASLGFHVEPDEVKADHLSSGAVEELVTARAELLDAQNVMNIPQNEPFLALAQVKFDCWLAHKQAYPEHVGDFACADQFRQAMRFLIAPPLKTGDYAVYFASNATEIDDEALSVIKSAAEEYHKHPGWYVKLVGYTDNKGDRVSNEILAQRRCVSVKNMLGQQGVDLDKIDYEAQGEAPGMTDAEDSQASRRVEIEIIPRYDSPAG